MSKQETWKPGASSLPRLTCYRRRAATHADGRDRLPRSAPPFDYPLLAASSRRNGRRPGCGSTAVRSGRRCLGRVVGGGSLRPASGRRNAVIRSACRTACRTGKHVRGKMREQTPPPKALLVWFAVNLPSHLVRPSGDGFLVETDRPGRVQRLGMMTSSPPPAAAVVLERGPGFRFLHMARHLRFAGEGPIGSSVWSGPTTPCAHGPGLDERAVQTGHSPTPGLAVTPFGGRRVSTVGARGCQSRSGLPSRRNGGRGLPRRLWHELYGVQGRSR